MKTIPATLCLAFILFLTGCPQESAAPRPADKQGDGFALLYSVSSQEQNVDKLLWVKDPGDAITEWIKQIATFNKSVTQQLEAWKQDGTVTNLKHLGLPQAESEARARATSRTTGELLWSTDIDLRVALVVAQLKALGYCADLCYAIGKETSKSEVKKVVSGWETQFAELNSKGMNILEVAMAHEGSADAAKDEVKARPPAFHKQ